MIIEIKVANYRSINAEQTLSFVADRATRHPGNLIKRPGYRLLKAVGMFGANASGKSNFVRAIGAMSTFVRDSATRMNDGDPIVAAEPYRLDPETRDQPSRFEITFVTDGTVYAYGFAADSERVHKEWLTGKSENNDKTILYIKRESHGNGVRDSWENLRLPGGIVELLKERTRPNALFLSTAARENVEELLPVYRYLSFRIQVGDASGDMDSFIEYTARRCEISEKFQFQINQILRDADTGIVSFSVEADRISTAPRWEGSDSKTRPPVLSIKDALRLNTPTPYILTRRQANNGTPVDFDFLRDESSGTQRLFGLGGVFLDAIARGSFLVLDEINASMHPLLTRKLLEMFQSPEANPNGAQLLFTTHDAVLLDSVLFRRDQIWLAEKRGGESTFYSLADIEPRIRNNKPFLRDYLAGRYGGTALFGRAFEELDLEPAK